MFQVDISQQELFCHFFVSVATNMSDNPYTKAPPLKGSSPSKSTLVKEPLYGFLSRKVKAEQVQGALVSGLCGFLLAGSHVCPPVYPGWRYQSIYEKAAFRSIQKDPRNAQKIARVRADGRVLQDGKCLSKSFLFREGRSESASGTGHPRLAGKT